MELISTFKKIMNLDNLDLSEVEPYFETIKEGDESLGYLTPDEKELYLISIFCWNNLDFYENEVIRGKDPEINSENSSLWNEKWDICLSLLFHIIRIRFNLPYSKGLTIVEDFLVVAYKKSEDTSVTAIITLN